MKKQLRTGVQFTAAEHAELAGHFEAIEAHATRMLDILGERVVVSVIDEVIKTMLNGKWMKDLKASLFETISHSGEDPYYGRGLRSRVCELCKPR